MLNITKDILISISTKHTLQHLLYYKMYLFTKPFIFISLPVHTSDHKIVKAKKNYKIAFVKSIFVKYKIMYKIHG